MAAYRAAVEAVTNVARHSDARSLCVELARTDGALALTVVDDGGAREPWAAGQGLRGMRERAEELGGHLTAGPTPDGGRLVVTYPLEDR
ncbi:hypothetical protein [Nocardioides sp.]|uniref:ATP-binding protein n=1 Tax=Nocardioides sp. TaxID=35761 RepID=UPI003529CA0B